MDPTDVVLVSDFSSDTLQRIINLLHLSTSFDHFVYRETELDEVWRLLEIALRFETEEQERERLQRLFEAVTAAHDLVAEGEPQEAARRLQAVL